MEYGRYGRAGGPEDRTKGSAKVQIGAELLCKSAKVFSRLAGKLTSWHVDKGDKNERLGGPEAPWTRARTTQRGTGDRIVSWDSR